MCPILKSDEIYLSSKMCLVFLIWRLFTVTIIDNLGQEISWYIIVAVVAVILS